MKLRTKSKKIIHIDIQLKVNPSLKNRIIFYGSKLITEQVGSGDDYDKINKVISIIITDEKLIGDSPEYHHHFTFYDKDAGVEFTDITQIYTIELQKLPQDTDGTELYDWAKFIAAETEDELDMVVKRNPRIKRAAVKLRELSADERARDMLERREKGRMDLAVMIREAEREKAVIIARNMLKRNRPIEEIIEDTGLTREEVEGLQATA